MSDSTKPQAEMSTAPAALPEGFPTQALRSQALSARKPTRFTFRPDAAARSAIARALDLIDLPFLSFVGEIRPAGRHDFLLEAQLQAKAVQPCSITLAPVPCTLDEAVRRRYDAEFKLPEAEEAEMIDDEVEALPEILDIAAIAVEALALALPLYPRAEGAELTEAVFAAPGVAPILDADLKPFAGLAGLAAKLKPTESNGD